MSSYIRYERRVLNNVYKESIALIAVRVTKDNQGKTIRITEMGPVHQPTAVRNMTSEEIDGWGSCGPYKYNKYATRNTLINDGVIVPGVYTEPKYLSLDARAVKSHMDDQARVSIGEEPSSCHGEGSDCSCDDEEYKNTIYDQWYELHGDIQ